MKKISEEIMYKGKWLSLKKAVFSNSCGKTVVWESVERNDNSRAFGIIARLIPSNRYILIKQFRQAINNYVIGLPAGITNPGVVNKQEEDACILQELEEETGYAGVITSKSPVLKLNPAIMDDDFILVHARVNENDPKNINVKQRLEPEEEIEIILLEEERIKSFLFEQNKMGVAIGSGVWLLANGF